MFADSLDSGSVETTVVLVDYEVMFTFLHYFNMSLFHHRGRIGQQGSREPVDASGVIAQVGILDAAYDVN